MATELAMYKKILVPYDISEPADNALEHAVRLASAGPNGTAEVILMSVIEEVPIYPVVEHVVRSRKDPNFKSFEQNVQHVYSSIKAYVAEILEEKCKKYQQRAGFKFKTEIVRGKPVAEILKYAEREHVELIVMGSAGLSRASILMSLGSVTRDVIEKSSCPVMIVR